MGNCFGSDNSSPSRTVNGSSSPGTFTSKTSSSTTTTTIATSDGKFSRSIGSNVDGQYSITSHSAEELDPNGRILEAPNLRIFTFSELRSATKNFKLGFGFGRVFKGRLDEKTLNAKADFGTMVIAVKIVNPQSMHGLEEWQSEVNFLGRLPHPHLVRLLGYCREDEKLLLVYEFMDKGSLENHIFGRWHPLSWSLRLKILIGAARGLAFLHTSEKNVIFRDFKASRILLDSNYNAKISNFGLAMNGPTAGDSHVTTTVMGTNGYVAPEYVATGHLYVKSDVYGFGVVLLEMLTGQRVLDPNRPSGQYNLVDWAKPFLSDRRRFVRIMDPRLEGQYPSKAAFQASQLTLRCLASLPKGRPSMKEVAENLEQIEAFKGKTNVIT